MTVSFVILVAFGLVLERCRSEVLWAPVRPIAATYADSPKRLHAANTSKPRRILFIRFVSLSCRILGTWGEVLLTRHSSMSVVELIRACAGLRDGAAWEEFVSRFRIPISLAVKRTACQWGKDPAQFVDDLLQETYLKLCANKCRLLLEFARQHPDEAVLGYIKTIAINVAHDHFKSLHSQKRGAGETDQLLEDFEPAARSGNFGGPEAMERDIFLKQVHNQLQNCAAGSNQERDCIIFWFYYLQGMSAKAIAALATIKLTAKGVEAVIFRLTRCVREHLGNAGMPDSADT